MAYGLHYDGCTVEAAAKRSRAWRRASKRAHDKSKDDPKAFAKEWLATPAMEVETVPGIGESINNLLVHGGLTYAREEKDGLHWFGFDCSHSTDFPPATHIALKQIYSSEEWGLRELRFGGSSNRVYRTIDFVREEVRSLARQLKELEVPIHDAISSASDTTECL